MIQLQGYAAKSIRKLRLLSVGDFSGGTGDKIISYGEVGAFAWLDDST
jgi:hypothetical protein